ncbi:PfkB family carbohydrate kinase [Taklimakanibacter deserti]|uniref:PfkB family carbohydrate kinase n=1 Tax=Taklimakanibacter deserti TaxID=2267839 RepID=UPI000E64B17C
MSRPKLVVVGNACRDVTYHLDRLPEPGETLIAREVVIDLGGKGLNQAVAAARAGAGVHLIAALGDDATAARIRAALQEEGMDDRGLITQEGVSDESLLLLDPQGENLIVSNTQRAQSLTPSQVEAAVKAVLDGADLLLLQGNLAQETTFHAMKLARMAGVKVAVNPSPFQAWLGAMPQLDLIIANQGEANALGDIRADMAVVTLGARGCRLRFAGRDIDIPAPKVQAIAAGGAGDVFAGTFIAEFLSSRDPERAGRLAVAAASDKATRHGSLSAFPRRAAINALRRFLV